MIDSEDRGAHLIQAWPVDLAGGRPTTAALEFSTVWFELAL